MIWNPPVPEGDTLEEHYHTAPTCRQPWEWCRCPAEKDEGDE